MINFDQAVIRLTEQLNSIRWTPEMVRNASLRTVCELKGIAEQEPVVVVTTGLLIDTVA